MFVFQFAIVRLYFLLKFIKFRIQTFLKEFVDPILFLRRELGSISQIVEVAMSQTNENLNICRTFSNLAWFGPIGVYKEDGQLL